jgi:hypothetical protein
VIAASVMVLDRDPGSMLPDKAAVRWCAWLEGVPGYYVEGPSEAAVVEAVRAKLGVAMGGALASDVCAECGEFVETRPGRRCARCYADVADEEADRKDEARAASMGGDCGRMT